MQGYERRKVPAQECLRQLRNHEAKLIKALVDGDSDQRGIIGREALGKLKRMPSAVYWRGPSLWGVRNFSGSIEQFVRQIEKGRPYDGVVTDDGEPLGHVSMNWDSALPKKPDNLLTAAIFDLTAHEAEFLKERVDYRWSQTRTILNDIVI